MKVLVIGHTYISPINRDKWKALAIRHPDIMLSVVMPKHWPSTLFTHEARIDHEPQLANCTFSAFDTQKEGNELLYHYNHEQLYTHMKRFGPDLVHVEQGDGAVSYLQANTYIKMLRLKSKSVFFTWLNWQPKKSLKHQLFLSPVEKINLLCSDGAIVGNHDAQDILHKKGFKKPIIVLPQLGINQTIFRPVGITETRSNNKKKYIGYIGRIAEEKGVFLLAEAFLALQQEFPSWNLVFIGKGPARSRLGSFVATNNLQNRIEFCSSVPHEYVAQCLRNIDILTLPSYDTPDWREQFGHVLIEAMACKVPVIGSNAGEIAHVIADTGLIFQQGNQQALLAQLRTLMHDQILREKLAQEGFCRIQSMYTHEIIADKTYSFWQKLFT